MRVAVAPPAGGVPAALDLSGTQFTLSGGGNTYTCQTGVTGECWFGLAGWINPGGTVVPAGSYTLTQTGSAPGLAPATGAGTVAVCEMMCGGSHPPVVNASVFRTQVVATVSEQGPPPRPVEGAAYVLTGPGYTLQDGTEVPGTWGPVTSQADGTVTFDGWFPPGAGYSLTPADPAEPATLFEITAPDLGTASPWPLTWPAWTVDRTISPVPPPRFDVPVTPVPVPAAVTPSAPVQPPASGRRPQPAVVVPPIVTEPPAEPATPSAPSATRTFDRSGAGEPTAVPLAGGTATPELTTVSSNLPDKGLAMALGALFLIVVLVAIGLVRRHARRRA